MVFIFLYITLHIVGDIFDRGGNVGILENAYGISLRKLMLFAINTYKETDPVRALEGEKPVK